ncbi:MAG TPA: YhbY family RNA-binding protein [Burkholderiales bacterium]|nr:YhbY family RNA-binding protein [Burkholderiales bacterium]
MARKLTPAERQALRGRAHRLSPVVLIGEAGLTPTVVAEVDRALQAHELIKIRVMGAERAAREAMLGTVCAATDAAPVQHIGKILVVYRERPAEERTGPPARPRKRPARASRSAPRRPPPHRAKIRSR